MVNIHLEEMELISDPSESPIISWLSYSVPKQDGAKLYKTRKGALKISIFLLDFSVGDGIGTKLIAA